MLLVKSILRVEESPFLEVEKPTMLNLQLMVGGEGVALQTQQLD